MKNLPLNLLGLLNMSIKIPRNGTVAGKILKSGIVITLTGYAMMIIAGVAMIVGQIRFGLNWQTSSYIQSLHPIWIWSMAVGTFVMLVAYFISFFRMESRSPTL
jgi:hypothetical protein